MKRFNAEMWSDSYMDESPTGEYVLYEDMVKLLAEKDALLTKALQIIKRIFFKFNSR